jgi:hypothetical protein
VEDAASHAARCGRTRYDSRADSALPLPVMVTVQRREGPSPPSTTRPERPTHGRRSSAAIGSLFPRVFFFDSSSFSLLPCTPRLLPWTIKGRPRDPSKELSRLPGSPAHNSNRTHHRDLGALFLSRLFVNPYCKLIKERVAQSSTTRVGTFCPN